jgi:hypothetical protein
MDGASEAMREFRDGCRVLLLNPYVKRLLGRPRRRRKDKIKMDFKEIGWASVDLIRRSQDIDKRRAVVKNGMSLRVQQNARNVSAS